MTFHSAFDLYQRSVHTVINTPRCVSVIMPKLHVPSKVPTPPPEKTIEASSRLYFLTQQIGAETKNSIFADKEIFATFARGKLFRISASTAAMSEIKNEQGAMVNEDPNEIYHRSLPKTSFPQNSKIMEKWQELDTNIKRKIFAYCMPVDRMVNLSRAFTKDVFPEGTLLLPAEVLCDVFGALESCRLLRDEITTYFWSNHHFYVALSYFTAPRTSIQSQMWLKQYLPIVQQLTIDFDLTRFGGRQQITAGPKDRGLECKRVEAIIGEYIDAILERCGADGSHLSMAVLNFVLREYTPQRAATYASKTFPMCAPNDMMLFDKLKELQGMVKTHQAKYFPADYAIMAASAIFGSTLAKDTDADQLAAASSSSDATIKAGKQLKRSPETMNHLNELDPAYVRSVSAVMGGLVLGSEKKGKKGK